MCLHCEARSIKMFSFCLLWKLLKETMRVILYILLIQIHYFQNNHNIVEQFFWLKLKTQHDVTHNLDTIA